jgi:hypothetical protein
VRPQTQLEAPTAGQSSGLGNWSGGRIVLVVGSSIAVLDGGPRSLVAD